MSHSAALSILAAIAVGFGNFFLKARRRTRLTVGKVAVEALEAGAKGAITVAVACAWQASSPAASPSPVLPPS